MKEAKEELDNEGEPEDDDNDGNKKGKKDK
jgi:hypothetical protein